MRPSVKAVVAVAGLLTFACVGLSSIVVVEPLFLRPSDIARPRNLQQAMDRGDYLQAIQMRQRVERNANAAQLATLGQAFMYCGRYSEATDVLRQALELGVSPRLRADIHFHLSQIAHQQGDYPEALRLSESASKGGVRVRSWYAEYLAAIQDLKVHRVDGAKAAAVAFRFESPDLIRLESLVNGTRRVDAVPDSGSVISIVSRSLADEIPVRSLHDETGVFYGLLGEPILVRFGMIDSIRLGDMTIRNIPVAIMEDSKLSFFYATDKPFKIDFLLGTSLLREFHLTFDYARKQLTLRYLEQHERTPAPNQNLFLVDHKPLVHVTINGRGWYPFLLDTGSEVTFLNSSKLHLEQIDFGTPMYHGATMQGLGASRRTGRRVKNIAIGLDDWIGRFEHLPLYADDSHDPMGIVGQNLLKHFYVEIDFGRMRVDIYPSRKERRI